MKFVSSLPTFDTDTAVRGAWTRIEPFVRGRDGMAYYKHPIILSATNVPPDLTVLARGLQPFVVKVFDRPLQGMLGLEDDTWHFNDGDIESPLLELEDYLVGLRARFDKQRGLRQQILPVGIITLPLVNRAEFLAFAGEAFDVDGETNSIRFLFRDDDPAAVVNGPLVLSDELWRLAQSVFQGVHPLNRQRPGVPVQTQRMGGAIKSLEHQIALLDDEQHQVATQVAPGPQRIRGLAGTGKTVILAMKAANIHLHYPEAKILFTFNTQSLYQQIERLISQFFRVNGDVSPNWDVLHVRHGWGSVRRPGVYSDACRRAGLAPLSFAEAQRRSSDRPFAAACRELLNATIMEEYDFVLMDEAQDFPAEFFQLVGRITKEPKRIYFAYDEMQSLTNLEIPNPRELFGTRGDGSALVDLEAEPYAGEIERDFILHRSYRCPRDVLLIAHAVGLGIHGPSGCVQMLSTRESWEAIGYTVEEGTFQIGDHMRLSRSVQNSPNKIAEMYTGNQPFISFSRFERKDEELQAVALRIALDIKEEQVRPEDIVVICLDNRYARRHFHKLQQLLFDQGVDSTIPGLVDDSWEFTQPGAVTLSTIYRAKGNEAPVVHLIGFEALYGYAEEVENRNRAFTSISRTKGWLRVYGSGSIMNLAETELGRIVGDLPELRFDFPNMEIVERKLDSAELSRRRKIVGRVKKGVADILNSDEGALRDLEPHQLQLLKERLTRISDEQG